MEQEQGQELGQGHGLITTRDALILGAALLLPLVVLSVREHGMAPPTGPALEPRAVELPLPRPECVGTLALPDGSQLIARLSPWRADPDRQRAESQALAQRLGWTLEGGLLELAIERSLPSAGVEPLRLEVSAPRVVDARGPCATSLPLPIPPGPVDPHLSLAAGLEGPLTCGQRARGLLWGQLPGPGARLELPLPLELVQP